MSDIQVNEFVRTKDGIIAKVTYIDAMALDTDNDVFDINDMPMMEIPTEYIDEYVAKHSFNIIDLIEVGDYVNGEKVTNIDNYDGIYTIEWEYGNVYTTEIINDKFIKSIVTREQFERSEYKVNKNV